MKIKSCYIKGVPLVFMMNVLGWSSNTWVESLHSQLPPHVASLATTNAITSTITNTKSDTNIINITINRKASPSL